LEIGYFFDIRYCRPSGDLPRGRIIGYLARLFFKLRKLDSFLKILSLGRVAAISNFQITISKKISNLQIPNGVDGFQFGI